MIVASATAFFSDVIKQLSLTMPISLKWEVDEQNNCMSTPVSFNYYMYKVLLADQGICIKLEFDKSISLNANVQEAMKRIAKNIESIYPEFDFAITHDEDNGLCGSFYISENDSTPGRVAFLLDCLIDKSIYWIWNLED
ncbi:MAG: hypothetical protein FWF78_11425 [Defluviitaleaceae bacterium]|nr:hypothetical protein [Defluviitaleaceae bacterium]